MYITTNKLSKFFGSLNFGYLLFCAIVFNCSHETQTADACIIYEPDIRWSFEIDITFKLQTMRGSLQTDGEKIKTNHKNSRKYTKEKTFLFVAFSPILYNLIYLFMVVVEHVIRYHVYICFWSRLFGGFFCRK